MVKNVVDYPAISKITSKVLLDLLVGLVIIKLDKLNTNPPAIRPPVRVTSLGEPLKLLSKLFVRLSDFEDSAIRLLAVMHTVSVEASKPISHHTSILSNLRLSALSHQ